MIGYLTMSSLIVRLIKVSLNTFAPAAGCAPNISGHRGLRLLSLFVLSLPLILMHQIVYCQPPKTEALQTRLVDGVIEIKLPEGFKSEGVDEPHIFKWTKNSAEIYVVVGERLIGSRNAMINAFRKATASDKTLDQTRALRISNAKGILIKEKTPSDPNRLMLWGLKIFTDKHEINVDFSAPAKDFKIYSPIFEEVIKSIKIKSS